MVNGVKTVSYTHLDVYKRQVIVDVDGENDLSDVVMIDESIDVSDFITLSDDTIMWSDAEMLDTYSTDIDGSDISFIL